jgi:FtsZ-binding cell division protein ZapB
MCLVFVFSTRAFFLFLQMTLEREREMRKAVERERTAASRAKEEVEEENERLQQQILQLQNLLQQAVEFHSVNHGAPRSDSFYGYQQHQQQVGV